MQAVAGTHTVLLGFDLDDPAGCLGFAIHRTDHTEGEARWLRGMKTFESVVPDPPPGSDWPHRTCTRCRASSGATTRPSPGTTTRMPCRPSAGRPRRRCHGHRVGEGAHRGRGRRRARGLVQPRRGRVAGLLAAVRRWVPTHDARRVAPGDGLAVPRSGRGAARVRRRGARRPAGRCAARSTSSPGAGPAGLRRRPRPRGRRRASSCTAATATPRRRPATTTTDRTAELAPAPAGRAYGARRPRHLGGRRPSRARCTTTSSWCCPPTACPRPSGPARPTSPWAPCSATPTSATWCATGAVAARFAAEWERLQRGCRPPSCAARTRGTSRSAARGAGHPGRRAGVLAAAPRHPRCSIGTPAFRRSEGRRRTSPARSGSTRCSATRSPVDPSR